jgi:hypothetical protein
MTGPRDASARHAKAKAFGYPLHRLVGEPTQRTNAHGVTLTEVTAACGATATEMGRWQPKDFRSARQGEFCENGCWD